MPGFTFIQSAGGSGFIDCELEGGAVALRSVAMFLYCASVGAGLGPGNSEAIRGCDLVITTYTMLCRLDWLRQRKWKLTVLDEAQAIKNSGIRQRRAAKELRAELSANCATRRTDLSKSAVGMMRAA